MLALSSVTAHRNTAAQQGGGLLCAGDADVTVSASSIGSNAAPLGGGLAVGVEDGCAITATSLTCTNNSAPASAVLNHGGGCAFVSAPLQPERRWVCGARGQARAREALGKFKLAPKSSRELMMKRTK